MFKTIGTIGAGPIGKAVAAHALKAGHPVLLSNSRGPDTLPDVISGLGNGAEAVTLQEAAKCDLVILAVPFPNVPGVGEAVGDWTGRIVIDATNQYAKSNPYEGRADTGDLTGSEWVAQHLPGATIIKAFNDLNAPYVAAEPRHEDGTQVVFYAGDDAASKQQFAELVTSFGFAPVDLGGLRDGGKLTQLDGPLMELNALTQS
jgi:8-hydroxy-5-deazaflavin:NADPH oxidoreductase